MRNLQALRQLSTKLDLPGSVVQFTCLNSEHQILYATTNTNMLLGIHMVSGEVRSVDMQIFRRMVPSSQLTGTTVAYRAF